MSRLTATQVIDRGDYLEADFDANTLTMPYLLSILTLHGSKYPTPYNKSKLVQTFNEQIKPRAAMLKKERLERAGSIASSRDITDGLTGQPVSEKQPAPRRSSRRLSRPPSLVPEDPPPNKTTPPKRRRSSAGPSLSRAPSARVVEPQQPTLIEESEPEEEPAKKVGRPRKSVLAAGVQARRVVHPDEIEGWSDNNVFQSGAESSSPARPSPNIKAPAISRRPTRRGRTSLSAPPQMPSSSPFAAPSSATFQPRLSPGMEMPRCNRLSVPPKEEDDLGGFIKFEPLSSSPIPEEIQVEARVDWPHEAEFKHTPEQFTAEVSRALAHGGSGRIVRRQYSAQKTGWTRVLTVILLVLVGSVLKWYKEKSVQIGYCAAGTDTNPRREEIIADRRIAEECARQLESHNHSESAPDVTCQPPSLLSYFEPTKCTPCPVHAYCTIDTAICEQSFVLQLHPLTQIPIIPGLLNGLPGFGPVAFPPRCVEDELRQKNIGLLSSVLEHYLAKTRGRKLCLGNSAADSNAVQWGEALHSVHDHFRKLAVPEQFEELFEEAITDLQNAGLIIMDTDGTKYIATASRSVLDFPCNIRVAARNRWNEWKGYVLGIAFLIISALWARNKIAARSHENRRVSDLVQIALDTLRNQELLHHTDPVTSPHAYLSSIHLRDLVLQDEHSIPVRRRLWDKVERVVEGNTNVRASMEELAGGDEGRVWRWVGGATSAIRSP
ncbi:Man1-Src1p-C-terminal domain-containing protein [Hysterangium stoloniferum]|nr:Man1-Src1p-C-terminal domain-containing protein [Hysterangium stoloniferum]